MSVSSSSRDERVLQLFNEAADLDPASRRPYLEEQCQDDAALFEEVWSLLSAMDTDSVQVRQALERIPGPSLSEIDKTQAVSVPQIQDFSGQTVQHFEIKERVGGGGMGVVYRALDMRLNREVALKFLPTSLSLDTSAKERFKQEAQSASILDHPNVCTIYEIGETDEGQLFIAMAYYEGRTLKTMISEGALSVEQVVNIAGQVANGLAKTHAKGIIHRDIKPANVMVTDDGIVKILDFGIAKASDINLTRAGTMLGTISYMSPEQISNQSVDHRTDLWSLGVLMFEMLTGARPFSGQHDQVILYGILNQEAVLPDSVKKELPAEVIQVLNKCLSKHPAERFQSADAFLAELERIPGSTAFFSRTLMGRSMIPGRGLSPMGRMAIAAGVALLVMVGIIFGIQATGTAAGPQRLAVLPFQSNGANAEMAGFSEGLLQTITSKLTGMEQFQGRLSVIPAIEVLSEDVRTPRLADSLFGAEMVISGTITYSGSQVRLLLTLIDTETRAGINSTTIDATPTNLLAFQDNVVRKLADLLQVELTPETEELLLAGGTTEPGAYEFYTQGLGYLRSSVTEGESNIDFAIDMLQRAVDLDSTYTLAHAALGEAYMRKYSITDEPTWIEAAINHGEQAVALDEDVPSVRITMGIIYYTKGEYDNAQRALLRALELDSTNPFAHYRLARVFYAQDRVTDAEEYYKRAINLKADYWIFYNGLGGFYHNLGRHEEAAQQYRQVINLRPDTPWGYTNLGAQMERLGRIDEAHELYSKAITVNPSVREATAYAYNNLAGIEYGNRSFDAAAELYEHSVRFSPTGLMEWDHLAHAYYWANRPEDARQAWERVLTLSDTLLSVNPTDPIALKYRADAFSRLGQTDSALVVLNLLEALPRKDQETFFEMAMIYEYLNNRELALHYLEESLKEGLTLRRIEAVPVLDAMRRTARYRELIARYIPG